MKRIDLPRIRATLDKLDAIAVEHPEAFAGRKAKQWTTILKGTRTMATAQVQRGRPVEGAEHTTQVAVRLPDKLLAMLDAYAAKHAEPGRACTRSDAIRMILASTLAAKEPSTPASPLRRG